MNRHSTNSQTDGQPGPLDAARRAFRLLVTGPHPISLDGDRFPGLPSRRLALDELRDLLLHRRCRSRFGTRCGPTWSNVLAPKAVHGPSPAPGWRYPRSPRSLPA